MNPIKCIRIERIPGTTPPAGYMPPGYSWCATQVEHVPGLGQWTTWALVPDEAPASSPTDADIQRRIALLTKAATLDAHPDRISGVDSHYATFDGRFLLTEWTEGEYPSPEWKDVDEAMFRREIERVAIRQLLAERGGK